MSPGDPEPPSPGDRPRQRPARDEARAIGLILLSVLAYSLLPVLGAYAVQALNPLVYVAKSFFQYALLQACVWLAWQALMRSRASDAPHYLRRDARTSAVILVSGLLIAASYSCLFTSFYLINKAGAAVLYESWPILVTIGLPLVMRRRFERLASADFWYLGVAFVGIYLVIGASSEPGPAADAAATGGAGAALGYLLAVSSAVTMAIAVILKTNLLKAVDLRRSAVPVVAFVEGTHRLAGSIVLLIVAFAVTDVRWGDLVRIDISTAFAVVELVGASAFWFAIIATRRSMINLLWYLAPMLAVLWLSLLELATVGAAIVLGGALIVAANVLAQRRGTGKGSS